MCQPFLICFYVGLSTEVVETYHIVFYSERVEQVEHCLCHHWRTTEVVLNIFRILMLLEIGVAQHRSDETCCVLYTHCICLWIWTVEGKMEVEVRVLFLQFEEVFLEEHFVDATCTIEVVHLAVAYMEGLEHVHDLCAKRCHTCATTYPNHFTTCVVLWTELSVRTRHDYLVAWLEREDVCGCDTTWHIHKAWTLLLGFERWSGNTDGERDDVALVWIVCHRVCTDGWSCVLLLEPEDAELLPCWSVEVTNEALVHILIVVDVICWNLDLCVRAWFEVHVLSLWQLDHEVLDEGSNVCVAHYFALPFLHTHY